LGHFNEYVWIALSAACVCACGDGDGSRGSVDLLDSGMPSIDAAFGSDARADGSLNADASLDAAVASDAAPSEADASRCALRTDVAYDSVIAERFFNSQSPISVAVQGDGALLSWSQFRGGKSRVFSRWYGVTADAVDAPEIGDDSTQDEVFSAPTSSGFLTTWSDDLSGHLELRARRSDDHGATLDVAPIALTSAGASQHDAVAAQGADGKILVAYTTAEPASGSVLLLSSDGSPMGPALGVLGFGAHVGRPALAAFRSGYLLAWVDADARRVHLQKLDAAGALAGAGVLIDGEGSAQGNLDIAVATSGGAVAWDVLVAGVRPEIRLRTFDADGKPSGNERQLTPFPDTGLRPALAAARGGYLLAYRSQQASTVALRLVLLDYQGEPVPGAKAALTITSLLQQDLPLAMRMTGDGRNVFVGWLDQTPNTTEYQLQRAWIGCD
jgi:hypothetical protein